MDDYMFNTNVDRCSYVHEDTSYLEMFSYSDPSFNTLEDHPLLPEQSEDFFFERGVFSRRVLPQGVSLLGGIRLIKQVNAQNADAFTPHYISLKPSVYKKMVISMNLPYRGIECSSVVGSFFWSTWDQNDENPHFQIIYRKADVRKKGKTRGWEIMLSHDLRTGITNGFLKCTRSSGTDECLKHLRAFGTQTCHPMLLPMIIHSHVDASFRTEIKQRDARDWLRRIEHALSMHYQGDKELIPYFRDGVIDLNALGQDLIECHNQVLGKRPDAYIQVLDAMKEATLSFDQRLSDERRPIFKKLHGDLVTLLEFHRRKWQGMNIYANTTLSRLEIQKSWLYSMMAQKESKLNLLMASEQRKLAQASKRDATTMKSLSLLGTVFLPGTFLAALFSTTFFDFQNAPNLAATISPMFWLYWAFTIPITLLVVGIWNGWESSRARRYEKEDEDLENGSAEMEKNIMRSMMSPKYTAIAEEILKD